MRQTRYSKQRELIYERLMGSREHPSAESIYQALKANHPSLSLGTVYRNLNLLVEEGRAVRIPFAVNRYDGTTREHPHFFCTTCESLYDLDLSLDNTLDALVESQGHSVDRHDLIFKGVCASCLRDGGAQQPKAKTNEGN